MCSALFPQKIWCLYLWSDEYSRVWIHLASSWSKMYGVQSHITRYPSSCFDKCSFSRGTRRKFLSLCVVQYSMVLISLCVWGRKHLLLKETFLAIFASRQYLRLWYTFKWKFVQLGGGKWSGTIDIAMLARLAAYKSVLYFALNEKRPWKAHMSNKSLQQCLRRIKRGGKYLSSFEWCFSQ